MNLMLNEITDTLGVTVEVKRNETMFIIGVQLDEVDRDRIRKMLEFEVRNGCESSVRYLRGYNAEVSKYV